jgi:hypothetical protein
LNVTSVNYQISLKCHIGQVRYHILSAVLFFVKVFNNNSLTLIPHCHLFSLSTLTFAMVLTLKVCNRNSRRNGGETIILYLNKGTLDSLRSFLRFEDLVTLDSAFCNRTFRSMFLDFLSESATGVTYSGKWFGCMTAAYSWISKRNCVFIQKKHVVNFSSHRHLMTTKSSLVSQGLRSWISFAADGMDFIPWMKWIFLFLTSLEKLCLQKMDDLSGIFTALPHLDILKECSFDGSVLSLKVFETLRECVNLEALSLSGCGNVRDESMQILSQGHYKRLTSLNLSFCAALKSFDFLAQMVELSKLDLNCTRVTDADMDLILCHCKSLSHIGLNCCSITDKTVRLLCHNCPSLTFLDIGSSCQSTITDQAIFDLCVAVSESRMSLLTLNISGCFLLTCKAYLVISLTMFGLMRIQFANDSLCDIDAHPVIEVTKALLQLFCRLHMVCSKRSILAGIPALKPSVMYSPELLSIAVNKRQVTFQREVDICRMRKLVIQPRCLVNKSEEHLRHLSVMGNSTLSGEWVKFLMARCASTLTELELSLLGDGWVNDVCIRTFVKHCYFTQGKCSSLRVLRVKQPCRSYLRDRVMCMLIDISPYLEVLDVESSTFSDSIICCAVKKPLNELFLTSCCCFTDRILDYLMGAKHLARSLRVLVITDCPKISWSKFKSLRESTQWKVLHQSELRKSVDTSFVVRVCDLQGRTDN